MRRCAVDERVRAALLAAPGVVPGSAGVVAFSGGPDSLCLLHSLRALAAPMKLTLRALVVDHGLRAGSAEEAEAACRASVELGVPADVCRLGACPGRGNRQAWAREQRLRALGAAARTAHAGWVAVGHTADDQAETVVMRALRGAGVGGLGAMARQRSLDGGVPAGRAGLPVLLLRPLLDVTRREIAAYLRAHGLNPLQDPTNATDAYLRNRVRRLVLPALLAENPRAVAALCRLADNCREADAALAAAADVALRAARRGGGFAVDALAQLPAGVLTRVLQAAIAQQDPSARRLDRDQLAGLCELVRGPPAGTRRIVLPGALAAERSYGLLRLVPRGGGAEVAAPAPLGETLVGGPGRVRLADGRWLLLEVCDGGRGGGGQRLDLERVRFPLLVRGPRAGDRITIGPGRRKKIARLMIDAKVPVSQRSRVPVLLQGEEVLLVVGLRSAHGSGAVPSRSALRVDWSP